MAVLFFVEVENYFGNRNINLKAMNEFLTLITRGIIVEIIAVIILGGMKIFWKRKFGKSNFLKRKGTKAIKDLTK